MRHIIDLCDLTEKEFSDLYKLVSNIIDVPEGYVDACRGKVLGSLFYEPSTAYQPVVFHRDDETGRQCCRFFRSERHFCV